MVLREECTERADRVGRLYDRHMFPFKSELDDLFRNDRSAWWKILCGVGVGALLGAKAAAVDGNGGNAPALESLTLTALLSGFVGGVAVAFCLMRDVVMERIKARRPVNPLLRAYLAAGLFSVIAWFVTIIGGTWFYFAFIHR